MEVVEYSEDSIAFELDEKSCRQSQLVSVDGIIGIKGKEYPFGGTGKITEIKKLGDKRIKAVIELHTYDKEVWALFAGHLHQRQNDLDKLFKAMKGEE